MRLLDTEYVTQYRRKGRHDTERIVLDLDAVVALIPHEETVEVCIGNSETSIRSLRPMDWWIAALTEGES